LQRIVNIIRTMTPGMAAQVKATRPVISNGAS
jgi:hypothetical protein